MQGHEAELAPRLLSEDPLTQESMQESEQRQAIFDGWQWTYLHHRCWASDFHFPFPTALHFISFRLFQTPTIVRPWLAGRLPTCNRQSFSGHLAPAHSLRPLIQVLAPMHIESRCFMGVMRILEAARRGQGAYVKCDVLFTGGAALHCHWILAARRLQGFLCPKTKILTMLFYIRVANGIGLRGHSWFA